MSESNHNDNNEEEVRRETGTEDDDNVEEHQPTMRAVALGSLQSTAPSMLRFDGGNPIGKPSAVNAGGWRGVTRPEMGKRKDSLSMQHEWSSEIQVPSSWNVKPENLEMVPQDFPLERTNREIQGCDATEVATRITKALKQLSICAEFDEEKARAKCQTKDYVAFRIRLYAGGISGEPVIVEVQRRSGDARGFMQSCRSILNAAEGNCVEQQKKQQMQTKGRFQPGKGPMMMKRPMELKCLQNVQLPTDYIQSTETALERVVEMIRKDEKDRIVMGLENLICLTDPIKSAPKCALYASRCLVLNEPRTKIATLRADVGNVFSRASATQRDEAEQSQDLDSLARSLCLKAMSNALTLTSSQHDQLLLKAIDEDKWFIDVLVPILLEELKAPAINLTDAYVAASCLNSLCGCGSDTVRVELQKSSDTLRSAHETGARLHELLEQETGRCLDKILE